MKDLINRLRRHALPDPHDEREVMHAPLLREAADALEAQQAEIEQARRTSQFHKDGLLAANAEINALRADAERYRWLRRKDVGPCQIWTLVSDGAHPLYMDLKTEEELDAAIDAARRK